MIVIRRFALNTVGIPADEECSSVGMPGIYAITGTVVLVSILVACGSGFIVSRMIPPVWSAYTHWATVALIALFAGIAIYWVDRSLIVAGQYTTGLWWNLLLITLRIGFVFLFSSNFAHEIVLCQYEKPLNATRLELEREHQLENKEAAAHINDVPLLKQSVQSTADQLANLNKQLDTLPAEVTTKISTANKARVEATKLWQQWKTRKKDNLETERISEKLHMQAKNKSAEASRLEALAQRTKHNYLQQVTTQITSKRARLNESESKLITAQEKAHVMVEARSEAIADSFASPTVNRVALDRLKQKNPSINNDILLKTFGFAFIELLPLLLKLLISRNNPIFAKVCQRLVAETSCQKSLMWLEAARLEAAGKALRSEEIVGELNDHAVIQTKMRLPFLKYKDLVEETILAARLRDKKEVTPELSELYFKIVNDALRAASAK